MKVEILKNCFTPGDFRSPTILKRGSIVELDDAAAKGLIDKGSAAKYEAPKEAKKGKKDEAPKEEPAGETTEDPAKKPKK